MIVALMVVLALAGPAAAQQDDFGALLAQAQAHAHAGRHDEAEATFGRALDAAGTDDERARARWMLAQARGNRGDREGELAALRDVLEAADEGPWVKRCLLQLVSLAERLNDQQTAHQAREKIVALLGADAPAAAPAALELARRDMNTGRIEAAVERLREVLAGRPPAHIEAQARALLVTALLAGGELEAALTAAREAPEPQRAGLMMRVAEAVRGEAPERAEAIAWDVLRLAPGHRQAMELIYAAASAAGAVDELRARLREQAEGDGAEAALRFLAQLEAWEDEPEASLDALERLLDIRPDDANLRVELAEHAVAADRFERAEQALRRALELRPDHGGALSLLGEVLVRMGRTDEAVELLEQASGYDPSDASSARTLGRMLVQHSLHHEAAKVYEEARRASGGERLLAFEMARAQIGMLHYRRAAEELLASLDDSRMPARMIGYELQRLAVDEIAGADVLATVEDYAAEAELPDEARLALTRVFLAAERHERARELLSGLEAAGEELADIAREAELRGELRLAEDMYGMALDTELPASLAAGTALRLAKMRLEAGRWRAALETLETTPSTDALPDAVLLRARLLLHRARRLDDAHAAYERLLQVGGDDPRYVSAARWGLAEWLFASGRLDEAEAAFAELMGDDEEGDTPQFPPLPPGMMALPGLPTAPAGEETEPDPPPARAALRLAEIALRRGNLEDARERLRLVAADYPASEYANDALQRLAFIRENLDGEGMAEEQYLRALEMIDRGERDEAALLLAEIAGTRGEPLADDALMLQGQVRAEAGEHGKAVATWRRLAERLPESLAAPEALLRAARVLVGRLDDARGAADALRRVIEDYPESAAADHARAELELLPRAGPAVSADAGDASDD